MLDIKSAYTIIAERV